MFPLWGWSFLAAAASLHSMAILSTLFRLWYQWHAGHTWWDDGWAALALLADIGCLVAVALEQPIPGDSLPRFFTVGNWIISFAYPVVMWPARLSILTAMIRLLQPEGTLRHISIGTGVFFGVIACGMLGQRIWLCVSDACLMSKGALISQTTTDCIADILLTGLPVWALRAIKLGRKEKILISAAFSATMVINIVTIIEAAVCFQSGLTSGSVIFEHVKLGCTMIVCNLLVIVTFVYRILHRGKPESEDSIPDRNEHEFTTVDLAAAEFSGFSQDTSKGQVSRTTKASTWSFKGGIRSKTSGFVDAPGSHMFVEGEEECR